jgi:hypothetical protein
MKASLSLDLDNLWSYLKTHGDPAWVDYPSYLETVVPHLLELTAGSKISVFVVGQDASIEENHDTLAAIAAAGHEIGNHSFRHEPWIHTYSDSDVVDELKAAHEAISAATGQEPVGFRGPGFSLSAAMLHALANMGYEYDASTLPTWIGPLARRYYFRSTNLSAAQIEERRALFGSVSDVVSPNTAYEWKTGAGPLAELPVTTMPLARVPIHISYLLYLSGYSMAASLGYFEAALLACRLRGQGPSILLHPLDLLGGDEVADLEFFPGMHLAGGLKRQRTARFLARLAERFEIVPCRDHVRALAPYRRRRTP